MDAGGDADGDAGKSERYHLCDILTLHLGIHLPRWNAPLRHHELLFTLLGGRYATCHPGLAIAACRRALVMQLPWLQNVAVNPAVLHREGVSATIWAMVDRIQSRRGEWFDVVAMPEEDRPPEQKLRIHFSHVCEPEVDDVQE